MTDTNNILSFLGIPEKEIKNISIEYENEEAFVVIDLKDIREKCPKCGSKNIAIKDYYDVCIRNSVLTNKKMHVEIHMRRYVCKDCKKSFRQKLSFYDENCDISNETKFQIAQELKTFKNITEISREFNVSPSKIREILDNDIPYQKRGRLPEVLCIDEFCFRHSSKGEKFPAVISDGLTGRIIDIVESRRKDYLVDYFSKIPFGERKNVKYFVSDMNDTYKQMHRIFFPDSIYLIDMFHISNLFNNCVREVRSRIMKNNEKGSKEYGFLKNNWKFFQMHEDRLVTLKKVNERTGVVTFWNEEVKYVLRKYNELNKAFSLKEEFYKGTRRLLFYTEAERLISFLIISSNSSLVPEVNKLGKSLQNWKYEIVNALVRNPYKRRLSNGVAEANNSVIEKLISTSFGLVNFPRLRKRILYIVNNKKTG